MVTNAAFRKLCLAFAETTEVPHFEKTSIRVHKKIFATLAEDKQLACIKLSEIDQSVFAAMSEAVYAVPNKWGKQGWTFINLELVPAALVEDALSLAYCEVAPKKLSEKYRQP